MIVIGCIYCIENKINGKKYIGQTIRVLEERIKEHFNKRTQDTTKLKRAINKYGKDNFEYYAIEEFNSGDLENVKIWLNDREKHYIKEFDTVNKGYNICYGGEFKFKPELSFGEEKALEVINLLNYSELSRKEISLKLGVNKDFITNIYNGKTYTYLWDFEKDNIRRNIRLNNNPNKTYSKNDRIIRRIVELISLNIFTLKTIYIVVNMEFEENTSYDYVKSIKEEFGKYKKIYGNRNGKSMDVNYDLYVVYIYLLEYYLNSKGNTVKYITEKTKLNKGTVYSLRDNNYKRLFDCLNFYKELGYNVYDNFYNLLKNEVDVLDWVLSKYYRDLGLGYGIVTNNILNRKKFIVD